jgi:hypothetical protein
MLIAACSGQPELSEQHKRDLYSQAIVLLDTMKNNGSINKEDWKKPIAALEPESLVVKDEGLYIKTGGFLMAEHGFFIPRPHTTVNQGSGTDPSYQNIGNGIYRYEVKG